jgi:hypothetical protein|tara:strand:- start:779 stop:1252 length:474 start_codon:yes stop_codon:yes gene_type:complete
MSPTKTTTKVKLPPNPFLHEILELAGKQRSKAKKVEILKEYENDALKTIFIWNFDDTVISVVPEGDVPYQKNDVPVGTDHTSLRKEYKHLYNFVKGGNDSLSSLRRETMFIQILEGLHPEEAEILCLTKDKRLQSKYKVTYDVVKEAYPDINWGGRS